MKLITHKTIIASLLIIIGLHYATAQEEDKNPTSKDSLWVYKDGNQKSGSTTAKDSIYRQRRIKELKQQHKNYVSSQKLQLKAAINELTEEYDKIASSGLSTSELESKKEKFEQSKKDIAADTAKRIKAHQAMIDSQIAFWEVREDDGEKPNYISFNLDDGIDFNFKSDRKYKKELSTISGFTLAGGYTFITGDDLDIDDFSYGNNNEYFGLGYQFSTAISKNQKWRVNYGLLYQSYGVQLNGNRIFTPNTSETQVVRFGQGSDKRKFRQDQLVVPFQLEFGGIREI